jgi:hypothetical protein
MQYRSRVNAWEATATTAIMKARDVGKKLLDRFGQK